MSSFAGMNDEIHQKFRNNILSATPLILKNALSDNFAEAPKSARGVCLFFPEKLDEANKQLEEKLIIESIFES